MATKINLSIVIVFLLIVLSSFMVDDPTFDHYKTMFEKDTGVTISKALTVNFSTRRGYVAGSCRSFPYIININPRTWYRISYIERKALIYHELSHCSCFRGHTEGYLPTPDLCFKSLMNPNMDNKECLKKHWKYYLTEFCLDRSKKYE